MKSGREKVEITTPKHWNDHGKPCGMERERERKEVEKKLPSIGESMEEKMNVGGIELAPESTLKEMRKA